MNPSLQTPMASGPSPSNSGPANNQQQPSENLQVSSMPLPPTQYFKNYTDDNVRKNLGKCIYPLGQKI